MNLTLGKEKISNELSYILGYLWADASISKKYNSVILECVKEDIDEVLPLFNIFPKLKLSGRKRENKKDQSSISISIKEFTDFLKDMDYLDKSFKSPDKILDIIGNDKMNFFYRGVSDGDGCFYHSKDFKLIHYVVSSSYDQDWDYMINLCRFLNIEKYTTDKILNENGHKHSRFRIINNKDIIKFGDFIYGGEYFGLSRKLNKFNNIKKYINWRAEQNKVYCYNLSGNLQFEFESVKSASDWLNKKRYVGSDIIEVCKGTQKTAFGYIWKRELMSN
jgi:hypothetical protein